MTKCLVILAFIIFLAGCSQPIVIHNNRLYAGFFNHQKITYHNGEYNKIKGIGLSIGLFAIGIGYYDLQDLTVDENIMSEIRSPIADVLIGYDKEPTTFFLTRRSR